MEAIYKIVHAYGGSSIGTHSSHWAGCRTRAAVVWAAEGAGAPGWNPVASIICSARTTCRSDPWASGLVSLATRGHVSRASVQHDKTSSPPRSAVAACCAGTCRVRRRGTCRAAAHGGGGERKPALVTCDPPLRRLLVLVLCCAPWLMSSCSAVARRATGAATTCERARGAAPRALDADGAAKAADAIPSVPQPSEGAAARLGASLDALLASLVGDAGLGAPAVAVALCMTCDAVRLRSRLHAATFVHARRLHTLARCRLRKGALDAIV